MQILAIETSGSTGTVAALDGTRLLAELALDPRQRSARTLAPGIKDILAQVGWQPADVKLVAVSIGPGSFTGLRLGVMTAKAFAYAVGAAVVGIGTLETIAAATGGAAPDIAIASDAQRGEVYSGRFTRDSSGVLATVREAEIVAIEEWLASLTAGTVVAGPALVKLAERLPPHAVTAPREAWLPRAELVGRLAAARQERGQLDDLWTLAPVYLRRSAAEEKLDSQKG